MIKPTMMDYHRHIIVCVGERCSDNNQGQKLYDMLGDKFKKAGLNTGDLRVKRSRATCFGTCRSGPLLCVQPDGIWYYDVTEEKLDRIIKEHFIQGKIIDEWVFHQGPGCKSND
ncbi:MAG: NAD(P)H-dependent oxidoreductase subunit E [Mariprofundaceae bacterium]|nr:NAD(P)H-dependent oxidoreductase subunit E [Mariprofundaceae bacterium]